MMHPLDVRAGLRPPTDKEPTRRSASSSGPSGRAPASARYVLSLQAAVGNAATRGLLREEFGTQLGLQRMHEADTDERPAPALETPSGEAASASVFTGPVDAREWRRLDAVDATRKNGQENRALVEKVADLLRERLKKSTIPPLPSGCTDKKLERAKIERERALKSQQDIARLIECLDEPMAEHLDIDFLSFSQRLDPARSSGQDRAAAELAARVETQMGLVAAFQETVGLLIDPLGDPAKAAQDLLDEHGAQALELVSKKPDQITTLAELREWIDSEHRFDVESSSSEGTPPFSIGKPSLVSEGMRKRAVEGTLQPYMTNYILRHFTRATMKLLLDNPQVLISITQGSVGDLLAYASATKKKSLRQLSDNIETDFASYIADGPAGPELLISTASGPAAFLDVVAHFTHYHDPELPGRSIATNRIQLITANDGADTSAADRAHARSRSEFVAFLEAEALPQIDVLILGQVESLMRSLAKPPPGGQPISPLRVLRSTVPPLYGALYRVNDGKTLLSLRIEPGLWADRSGVFLTALFGSSPQGGKRPHLIFAGTAGAMDQTKYAENDVVAPDTFAQVDELNPGRLYTIDNQARSVLRPPDAASGSGRPPDDEIGEGSSQAEGSAKGKQPIRIPAEGRPPAASNDRTREDVRNKPETPRGQVRVSPGPVHPGGRDLGIVSGSVDSLLFEDPAWVRRYALRPTDTDSPAPMTTSTTSFDPHSMEQEPGNLLHGGNGDADPAGDVRLHLVEQEVASVLAAYESSGGKIDPDVRFFIFLTISDLVEKEGASGFATWGKKSLNRPAVEAEEFLRHSLEHLLGPLRQGEDDSARAARRGLLHVRSRSGLLEELKKAIKSTYAAIFPAQDAGPHGLIDTLVRLKGKLDNKCRDLLFAVSRTHRKQAEVLDGQIHNLLVDTVLERSENSPGTRSTEPGVSSGKTEVDPERNELENADDTTSGDATVIKTVLSRIAGLPVVQILAKYHRYIDAFVKNPEAPQDPKA